MGLCPTMAPSTPFVQRPSSACRINQLPARENWPWLAEGFAEFRSPKGRRRFHVALSVEKDRDAHRTLRLRAFLRTFGRRFPSEYYDFLNGRLSEEPDWASLYPRHWSAACDETRCMELGTPIASAFLRERIAAIREQHDGRTVLLGGPPCQTYSVIGRSRNAGNDKYDADRDDRESLYEQYARVLEQLRPAVAVMENVKGILSARRNGKPVFLEGKQISGFSAMPVSLYRVVKYTSYWHLWFLFRGLVILLYK